MHMKLVEFKFPNGDFEIDTAVHVPTKGEVMIRRGQAWKVDLVVPGWPPVIMLEPARELLRSAKVHGD